MKNKWFTLVELIVIITILAILSTIGFVSYVDYLRGTRDGSRLQQMSAIHSALSLYATRTKLPQPENGVSVMSSTTPIGVQWEMTQNILDKIKYWNGWKDPKTKDFFTYFVSANRKSSQLLWFFEETQKISTISTTFAETDYSILYPYVYGEELWVLIENETQTPINKIDAIVSPGTFDILTQVGTYISYFTNTQSVTGSGEDLFWMVPNTNCKKLHDTIWWLWSGIYRVNPTGLHAFNVYCNMDIDGWWWTLVARSISWWSWAFSWLIERWDIRDDTSVYSLWPDVTSLNFSEIMLWTYSAGKTLNRAVKVDVDKTYVKDSSNFKYMRGTKWCTEIYSTLWSFRSACDTTWEDGKTADRNQFNVWWNFHKADDTPRDQYFFDQNTGLFTNNTTGWSLNGGVTANGYTNGDGGSWLASGFGEFVNEQAIIFVR